MSAKVSSVKVACFTFLGLYLPCVLIQLLGAAFAAAALSPDSIWGDAFTNDSIGGLLGVALIAPLGGFGKFLLVVLALGIISE